MDIYKKTNNPIATFGENSPSVLALQKELNAKYAGQTGYVPLKEDSLYGEKTKAATTFKPATNAIDTTKTGTTIPEDITRYARTTNPNDTTIADLQKKLDSTVVEPNLENITKQKRDNANAMISAIQAEFARTLDEQNTANEGYNARVRASNITSGLGGSDFGTARAIDQEGKNKKAIDLINAEKQAKIEAVLADADSRATEEYKQQRQDYIKGLGDQLDRVKQAKDEDKKKALGTIQGLASQGVPVDKLKSADPNTYQTLLNEYGGSQLDLESAWNDALPDNLKVKYEDKIIQGSNGTATLFRYGLNPVTGTVDKKEYDLGVDFNKLNGIKPVNVGGQLFALTTDANGDQIAKPLTDVIKKKNQPTTFTPESVSQFNSKIEKSRGKDGYVDPYVYKDAFDAWITGGGLAKDFVAKYPPKKYVNPKATNLPDYLRSSTAKSTSASEL